ncbi:hypothetical protein BBI01_03150 [Chryseobacterium artocarpi]|uniref:Uncharacterized protein n=1 Tax=Chryseobacterium artocarpi TaxID=1414727 RepID=A0A1B9A0Z8_9FLAO|nr:hypothetical protein BBI01_03150 [Chryseobacterium artocarpi]
MIKIISISLLILSLNSCKWQNKKNDFSYFEKNGDYFTRDIDINEYGFKDKVVSSKRNIGDYLIFF